MNIYKLNATNKEKENNAIKHILHNNKYDTYILNRFTKTEPKEKHYTTKCAKFTYVGKETKFITKLFKDSSLEITFTTRNTISKLLSSRQNPSQQTFDNSGVYQHTCPDCNMK